MFRFRFGIGEIPFRSFTTRGYAVFPQNWKPRNRVDRGIPVLYLLSDGPSRTKPTFFGSVHRLGSLTLSRAFIKLESLEELTPQQREEYEELAMDIFVKYSPKDSRGNRSECASCETMIPDW